MPHSNAISKPEGKENVLSLQSGQADAAKLPQHVAIIMDGNGRWAKAHGWHRSIGHLHGTSRVEAIIKASNTMGIKYLTLFAFSTENWKRPKGEIETLMKLCQDYLFKAKKERELIEGNIQLRVLGQIERLPTELKNMLEDMIEATSKNTGMVLNFCFSYGGRAELVRAVQSLALDVQEGRCSLADLTEEKISSRLYTTDMPDPDLLIRTSGEFRLSNFMLWQLAYSEIYITDVLWPDFTPEHLTEACLEFSKRRRRFGSTDEIQPTNEHT